MKFWDFILVNVMPILHIEIGIGNDIINYYDVVLDTKIVQGSQEDAKLRCQLEVHDTNFKSSVNTLKSWDTSVKGKRGEELM